MPKNVGHVREEIEAHITLCMSAFVDSSPSSDFHAKRSNVYLDLLGLPPPSVPMSLTQVGSLPWPKWRLHTGCPQWPKAFYTGSLGGLPRQDRGLPAPLLAQA
jgi:hypothetical protein